MKRFTWVKYFILSLAIALVSSLVSNAAFAQIVPFISPYSKSAFNYERTSMLLSNKLQDSRLAMLWRISMSGESFSTVNENSDVVGTRADFLVNYKLLEDLYFDAGIRFNLESGYSQSIFGEVEPGSNITPLDAVAEWRPASFFKMKAGIVSQGQWDLPIFLRRIAFPGASETFTLASDNKRYSVSFNAQQLIPTSSTLATRVREREDSPQLFTETIEVHADPVGWVKYHGRFSLFNFNKLPHQVAFDSQAYGNTINNGGPNTAEFVFGFNGMIIQNNFEFRFNSKIAAIVNWSIIKNNSAADSYNDAQMVNPGFALDFGKFILNPNVTFYFVESDAVPAFYNDFQFGHNNRQGINYQLSTEIKEWNIRFRAGYTDAKVLNDSFFQQDIKYIYLTMDMAYDII